MIGFSIMMWFVSVILLVVGVCLLNGKHTIMHGKTYEKVKEKEMFAKAVGKPVTILALFFITAGVFAVSLPWANAIYVSIALVLLGFICFGTWTFCILKKFSN